MVKDYRALLANKKFIYLWISQLLSQFTIQLMNFLLLVNIFRETGSAIATSLLWIAYALPAIIIGPVAYVLADLLDKRKLLIYTNLLQAATIFLYALIAQESFFVLYIVVFMYSLLNQFYVPAESSSLPSVVKQENLAWANGLFSLTQQASIVIGFGIAGFLNSSIGFINTLILCGIFMLIAYLSVLFLPKIAPREKVPKKLDKAIVKLITRISEGYSFIKTHKEVLFPSLLLVGLQIIITVLIIVMPQIAHHIVRIDINYSGVFIVVPAGLGAIAGSIMIPRRLANGWRKKRMIDYSILIISIVFFTFSFLIPQFNYYIRIILSLISFFFAGIATIGIIVPAQTYIQIVTPYELRGRVFGNFWFLGIIGTVLPVMLAGLLVQIFGIRFLLAVLSALVMGAFIWSERNGSNIIKNDFVHTQPVNR